MHHHPISASSLPGPDGPAPRDTKARPWYAEPNYEPGDPHLREGMPSDVASRGTHFDPSLTLEHLRRQFMTESAALINERTAKSYREDWAYFTAWLTGVHGVAAVLGAFTTATLASYAAWLRGRPKQKGDGPLSSYTVQRYMRSLRTFGRWMVAQDILAKEPLVGGKRGNMPRLGSPVLKVATVEDVETLLKGARPCPGRHNSSWAMAVRDTAAIYIFADTGPRLATVALLEIGDVDVRDGWVLARRAKGGVDYRFPITAPTAAWIKLYLEQARPLLTYLRADEARAGDRLFVSVAGKPLTPNGLAQAIQSAWERGGGSGPFGAHRMRHLYGTANAEAGVDETISMDNMGQRDKRSQKPYKHGSPAARRREHERVSPVHDLGRSSRHPRSRRELVGRR